MRKRHPGRLQACACAGLLLVSAIVHADSVFSCRNARGAIAYQDHACAAGERQAEVVLDPPPPAAARFVTHERTHERSRMPAAASERRRTRGSAGARTAMSWECRAADGAVFYRHGSCPKTIGSSRGATIGARGGRGATVTVTASPLPRAEACRRLAHAGGRSGREHDETVSTYERNAGRDPCRRY